MVCGIHLALWILGSFIFLFSLRGSIVALVISLFSMFRYESLLLNLVRFWISFPLLSFSTSSIEVNYSSIKVESGQLDEDGRSFVGTCDALFFVVVGAIVKPNFLVNWCVFDLLLLELFGLNDPWVVQLVVYLFLVPLEVEMICASWMLTFRWMVVVDFNFLVLGAKKKHNSKVWGAFQNPLVLDCSMMLLLKNLEVWFLGSMLKPKFQVMGAWKNPWYLM